MSRSPTIFKVKYCRDICSFAHELAKLSRVLPPDDSKPEAKLGNSDSYSRNLSDSLDEKKHCGVHSAAAAVLCRCYESIRVFFDSVKLCCWVCAKIGCARRNHFRVETFLEK